MRRWPEGLLGVVLVLSSTACGSESDKNHDLKSSEGGGSGAPANSGGVVHGSGGSRATGGRANNGSGGTPSADGGSPSSTGGTSAIGGGSSQYFGSSRTGNFWLGPVDYAETDFHNACAPSVKYPKGVQQLYGNYIMGLANEVTLSGLVAGDGQLCDACVELKANGKTLIARAVTYGEETGPNDIDVSPEIDTALGANSGRTVTWQFVSCPTAAPIQYTFDGRQWSNTWFFRLWVRNARVPVKKLEYRLGTGAWSSADWQSDGAWQASSEDFSKGFSLRLTAIDGQTVEDALPGLNTFDPDVGVSSKTNFR